MSKAEKYIDLLPAVLDYTGVRDADIRIGIMEALHYLDGHPEAAPSSPAKPTITESRRNDLTSYMTANERDAFHEGLFAVGAVIVPDPVPTNAGRLLDVLKGSIAGDYGIAHRLAAFLDSEGVSAPGGEV